MTESLNVLVVDDDPTIHAVFEDFFDAEEGYSVVKADNGHQALEICRKRKIDFCFTDLMMPKMDGVEFASKMQEVDNTIPVVVMTGYPSSKTVLATLKKGVADFLVKPFRGEVIALTIRKTLEKRKVFVENILLKEELKSKERLACINRELSDKVNDLNVLNLIMQKLEWFGSSAALFDMIVKLSGDITGSEESYFHVLDESLGSPVLVASFCRSGNEPKRERLGHLEAILAKRMGDGIPLLVETPSESSSKESDICSLIATPLKIRENTFGILSGAKIKRGSSRFTEKDLYYLDFMARRAAFVIENVALYENIYENLFATLYAFVGAIEARDPYTKQHSSRVSEAALAIGNEMGCSNEELERLGFSGHLHDIGKIGIRDSILLKPGPLTKEEFEVIKKHPTIGASIIGHLGLMSEEQKIIRHHHERWDGSGYPDGLKGQSIPFLSRILAVADVYDAMASDRAYRKKIRDEIIIDTIQKNAGTQFDETVVHGFLKAYGKGVFCQRSGSDMAKVSQPFKKSKTQAIHKCLAEPKAML